MDLGRSRGRCYALYALRHIIPDLDPAVLCQILRKHDVVVARVVRHEELLPKRIEQDATIAVVRGVHVLVACGIVKLFCAGGRNAICGRTAAVVDAGIANVQRGIGYLRRQVAHQKLGRALDALTCHQVHNRAVTVGVLQVTV